MCYTTSVRTSQPTHPRRYRPAGAATSRADTRTPSKRGSVQSFGTADRVKSSNAEQEQTEGPHGAEADETISGWCTPRTVHRAAVEQRQELPGHGTRASPETVNQSFSLTDRPPPCGAYNLRPQGTTQTRRPGESPEVVHQSPPCGTESQTVGKRPRFTGRTP